MPDRSTLTRELHENGFVVIREALKQEDVDEVRALLGVVFDKCSNAGGRAPGRGEPSAPQAPLQPDVNRAVRLEPRLKRVGAYRQCRTIASRILDRQAYYIFDHAIFRHPHCHEATEWHQDQAYMGQGIDLGSLHFWIPLQDVSEENGCMEYVPRSHRQGLVEHAVRTTQSGDRVLVARTPAVSPVVCSMRAGDVSVHHPCTMHFVGPNRSDAARRAWIIHFGPFGALAYLRPRTFFRKIRKMIDDRAQR